MDLRKLTWGGYALSCAPAGEEESGVAAEVRLVDLAVIKKYSLAVRKESAPAEEVLEALEDSAAVVLAALEAESALPPRYAEEP